MTKRPNLSLAFKQRRTANWLILGFTYAVMYAGRYNLSFANLALSEHFGWDKSEVGTIVSAGLLVYGLSAFVNGPLADRMGGRRAMLLGAGGSVVFNLLFGLGAYFGFLGTGEVLVAYLATVWSLNSYFQSFSALSLIKVNSAWFHIAERGIFSALFGAFLQLGRLLIFASGAYLVALGSWPFLFFVPAALILMMCIPTFLFVRNDPKDCNLAELDPEDATRYNDIKRPFLGVIQKIWTDPVAITIATSVFCMGFVRHGFEQWFPRYMLEAGGLEISSPVFIQGSLIVVGAGILGSFIAGSLSDFFFDGRRPPIAFFGFALQVCAMLVVTFMPSIDAVILAFVVNSFAVSVVHTMLSGAAAMDFGGKDASATAAGMFDGMGYLGGAATGVGVGALLDRFGWGAWGPTLVGFAGIGAFLMLLIWSARPGQRVV
jgi:MFS transporter, OPA family, glycerol-3-phosphate transporter